MKVIVRTFGANATEAIAVVHHADITITKEPDGGLVLQVPGAWNGEHVIARFAPHTWRSAVIDNADLEPEDLSGEADHGDDFPDDEHPF